MLLIYNTSMIQFYPAKDRYHTDSGPVGKSYFSFSFDEYYDPQNMSFGPMRVLNDDFAVPGGGVGTHPHRDMEIVSLMLSGGWVHKDSMGNEEVTAAGEIQRMTAGAGIYHSEFNVSKTEVSNGFQMWFLPETRGLKPSYEQVKIDFAKARNQWLPVVRRGGGDNVAHIHQDMTIHLTQLDAGAEIIYTQTPGRRIFLMVIEGTVQMGEYLLGARDSLRLTGEERVEMKATAATYVMLIDLP